MVIQNKLFSFKIKRQAKNVFPSDVERTVVFSFQWFTFSKSTLPQVYSSHQSYNSGISSFYQSEEENKNHRLTFKTAADSIVK